MWTAHALRVWTSPSDGATGGNASRGPWPLSSRPCGAPVLDHGACALRRLLEIGSCSRGPSGVAAARSNHAGLCPHTIIGRWDAAGHRRRAAALGLASAHPLPVGCYALHGGSAGRRWCKPLYLCLRAHVSSCVVGSQQAGLDPGTPAPRRVLWGTPSAASAWGGADRQGPSRLSGLSGACNRARGAVQAHKAPQLLWCVQLWDRHDAGAEQPARPGQAQGSSVHAAAGPSWPQSSHGAAGAGRGARRTRTGHPLRAERAQAGRPAASWRRLLRACCRCCPARNLVPPRQRSLHSTATSFPAPRRERGHQTALGVSARSSAAARARPRHVSAAPQAPREPLQRRANPRAGFRAAAPTYRPPT